LLAAIPPRCERVTVVFYAHGSWDPPAPVGDGLTDSWAGTLFAQLAAGLAGLPHRPELIFVNAGAIDPAAVLPADDHASWLAEQAEGGYATQARVESALALWFERNWRAAAPGPPPVQWLSMFEWVRGSEWPHVFDEWQVSQWRNGNATDVPITSPPPPPPRGAFGPSPAPSPRAMSPGTAHAMAAIEDMSIVGEDRSVDARMARIERELAELRRERAAGAWDSARILAARPSQAGTAPATQAQQPAIAASQQQPPPPPQAQPPPPPPPHTPAVPSGPQSPRTRAAQMAARLRPRLRDRPGCTVDQQVHLVEQQYLKQHHEQQAQQQVMERVEQCVQQYLEEQAGAPARPPPLMRTMADAAVARLRPGWSEMPTATVEQQEQMFRLHYMAKLEPHLRRQKLQYEQLASGESTEQPAGAASVQQPPYAHAATHGEAPPRPTAPRFDSGDTVRGTPEYEGMVQRFLQRKRAYVSALQMWEAEYGKAGSAPAPGTQAAAASSSATTATGEPAPAPAPPPPPAPVAPAPAAGGLADPSSLGPLLALARERAAMLAAMDEERSQTAGRSGSGSQSPMQTEEEAVE
jgi:hypothetical protein